MASESATVIVSTGSEAAAEEFVREYVLDAVDRLPDTAICDLFTFAFAGGEETGERSRVMLGMHGDVDAIIEQEEPQWDAFIDDSPATDWEVFDRTTMEERIAEHGEDYTDLSRRLNQLEVRMAKLAYEEFDEFPAAVDTLPESDGDFPIGWWGVLHTVTVQLNYSLDEELAAYEYGIEHTLRNIAEHRSPAEAEEALDDLIASLESRRERILEGRLDTD